MQFGFRRDHSTKNQLIRVITDLKLAQRQARGLVTLDIEKAFDSITHAGLVYKMVEFKLPNTICIIISTFLINRTFIVHNGDSSSYSKSIIAGVPQGSCLSPSL